MTIVGVGVRMSWGVLTEEKQEGSLSRENL
jgi:hypothetical protein